MAETAHQEMADRAVNLGEPVDISVAIPPLFFFAWDADLVDRIIKADCWVCVQGRTFRAKLGRHRPKADGLPEDIDFDTWEFFSVQ